MEVGFEVRNVESGKINDFTFLAENSSDRIGIEH